MNKKHFPLMKLYLLSGLGADERAFQSLYFPKHIQVVYLNWLPPLAKETMQQYAKRMANRIDTAEPFFLAGLSFGGMLVTEMLEYIHPIKSFLISSVACRKELPAVYKLAGILQLNKLLPEKTVNKANPIAYWYFSVRSQNEKHQLQEVLAATDPKFSKWAIHEIVNWKRKQVPQNIIRIHGSVDRVLPIKQFRANYVIEGGGHLMVANRALEVSEIFDKELQNNS
jgi:pimeloyl-ACP methyl ester carboxylesterase